MAKIALARARQLAAAGVDELAATEFDRAAALAPNWIEAQREAALWHSRHEQWEPAAIAWSRVLALLHDKRSKEFQEATTAFEQAKSNLAPGWTPPAAVPAKTPQPTASQPAMPKATPKPLQVAKVKLPRLTQVPARSQPAVTGPSGMPLKAAPTYTALPPTAKRIAKSFPLKSTPSLAPRRVIAPHPVAPPPRVAAPPRITAPPRIAALSKERHKPRRLRRITVKPVAQKREVAGPFMKRATRALRLKQYEVALKWYQRALAKNPKNQQAQEGITETLLLLKRYDFLEANYRRVLAVRPDDTTALHGLARVLMARKDIAGATRIYQQVLAANPDDFIAIYQIARMLTWERRYDAADPYYRKALALQPANPEAWAAWGEALFFTSDTRGRGAFERALQLRPGYMRARLGLANLFVRDGDYENAIAQYQAALADEPHHATALIGIGDALTYSGHESDALNYYRAALRVAPNSPAALLGLGRALIYAQQYAGGIPHLQSALKIAPENEQATQLLAFARINLDAHGEAAAIAAYRALLKRQPELSRQALSWAAIGQLKTRQGDLPGAREAYAVARRMSSGDTGISLIYAQSLMQQDQWSEAAPVVAGVLNREPENTYALILQLIIEARSGTAERTGVLASQLTALGPASLQDTVQIARALRQAGKTEQARQVLTRFATKNIANGAMTLQIADAARELNDYESAIAFYKRVPATEPRYAEARLKLVEAMIKARQYEAARQEIDTELERDKNNLRARILRAVITARGQTGDSFTAAKNQADAILTNSPKNASAYVLAGDVMSTRKFYGAALDHYRMALQIDPANLEARLGLARSLRGLRRNDAALEQYQELMRRAPGDAHVKLECAQLYLEQENLSDAGLLFNQVLALSRSFVPPLTARVEPAADRRYAAAVAAISEIRINSWSTTTGTQSQEDEALLAESPLGEQVLALRGMGEIRSRQERFADAATYFRRALQLEPADTGARLGLAQSLRAAGDYAAAQTETEAVLAADADNIIARALRVQLLLDRNNSSEAQSQLNNLINNLIPTPPAQTPLETYLTLHQSFSRWRNFSTALRFLEMARQAYPEKPELARLMGETLVADNQWEKALEAFDQALAANPHDISVLMKKARIYAASNRLTDAESVYRRVINEQKDNHEALAGLAAVLARRGDWAGALPAYSTAFKQDRDDLKIRLGLARALRYQLLTAPASTDWGNLDDLIDLLSDGSRASRPATWSAAGFDLWF